MDRLNISKTELKRLEILNLFFSFVFLIEMIIKQLGLGLKEYFRDRFNSFDAFIVIISLADFVFITFFSFGSNTGTGAVTAFRAFRLLRVFKLAKSW